MLVVEVHEAVQAAAGEELLAGAGGVAALHGGLQHGRQAAVRRAGDPVGRPAGERVGRLLLDVGQEILRQVAIAGVQLAHDLEVGDQRAQLGRGPQVELRAFVDVERLVQVVGLDAQDVGVAPALEQHDAEHDLGEVVIAHVQQALAGQPDLRREGRIGQAGQHLHHAGLDGGVERGLHGQVHAVQLVEAGHPQHGQQARADGVGRLLLHEAGGLRQGRVGAEDEAGRERRVAQALVDHARVGQHAQMDVGQALQRLAVGDQVVGRPALGQDQAQHLLVKPRLLHQRLAFRRGGGQSPHHVGQLGPEPRPQPVAQPVHLPEAGARGEGRGVQVVHHDALAGPGGVLPGAVGAHAGRRHLAQLLHGAGGLAVGGVAVLLDLGGERGAAGNPRAGVEPRHGQRHQSAREPIPFDRRVAPRLGGVQQLPVLDVQQRAGDQRRHVLEPVEHAFGEAGGVDHRAGAVEHRQPGAGLLVIDGVETGRHEPVEPRRHRGLHLDGVHAVGQRLQVGRYADIPETLVVRAVGGVARGWVRPLPQGDRHVRGVPGEQTGLKTRRVHLRVRHQPERAQADQPVDRQQTPPPRLAPHGRPSLSRLPW